MAKTRTGKKSGSHKSSSKKTAPKKKAGKKTRTRKPAAKKSPAKKVNDRAMRETEGQAPLAALSDQELLELQDELGLPPGTRPEVERECRRVLAFHEAGHAVIGHILGRRVRAASVTEHCEFEPLGKKKWSDLDLRNSIKIALAGPHAEVCASKESVSVGAGSDIPRARDEAYELAGDAWKERLEELSAEAQALVFEHWAAIERVAGRLVKFAGTITDDDLPTLIK